MIASTTSSHRHPADRPDRDHKHAPPQPAPAQATRPWAGHQVQALPQGPVTGATDPNDSPEGAIANLEAAAALLCLGALTGSYWMLKEQGYLSGVDDTPVAVALGLITLTLLIRKELRMGTLALDEPRRIQAAGLTRKEQLERAVQRANQHALSETDTRTILGELRRAALLQSEDEPGNDRHITGLDVAQAIARLGRGAALAREGLVPRRVALLQEALMQLLHEQRITVDQCAQALVLLAASVAVQWQEDTSQGRPPSREALTKVTGRLIAPFRAELGPPVPAWAALTRERAWQCLLDVLQLPVLDTSFEHFLGRALGERPRERLQDCFERLRRYTDSHIAAALSLLHGSPVHAPGPGKGEWQRLVKAVMGLVARHPQRLEPGAVDYISRLIALRARPHLPAADRKAALDHMRHLARLLAPRMNDALRHALTHAWILALRAGGASEADIVREVARFVPPGPHQPAPPQPEPSAQSARPVQPVAAAADPDQPGLMPPALVQAIEQARAQAWADRGDRKGLSIEEQSALDMRIAQLKKAAAGPLEQGT